jgi:hypothetical protein
MLRGVGVDLYGVAPPCTSCLPPPTHHAHTHHVPCAQGLGVYSVFDDTLLLQPAQFNLESVAVPASTSYLLDRSVFVSCGTNWTVDMATVPFWVSDVVPRSGCVTQARVIVWEVVERLVYTFVVVAEATREMSRTAPAAPTPSRPLPQVPVPSCGVHLQSVCYRRNQARQH